MNAESYLGQDAPQRDMRELERIAVAGDRMGMVVDRLTGFCSRFRGMEQAMQSGPTPVRSGYSGALDDLFDKLNALENLASEIVNLG